LHSVELIGAPDSFKDRPVALPYGITAVPLTYVPAIKNASELSFVREDQADAPDLVTCWKQAEPGRALPNLQKMPITVMTSEASYRGPYDHCTVKYLQQAGLKPPRIRLAELGIRGNSYVNQEKNNKEIAPVIYGWLDEALPRHADCKSNEFFPAINEHSENRGKLPNSPVCWIAGSSSGVRFPGVSIPSIRNGAMLPVPGLCFLQDLRPGTAEISLRHIFGGVVGGSGSSI
jgi:hypothetical protein